VVDRYIEHSAKPRQRTWQETKRILECNCESWLKRPFAEITKADARDLIRSFLKEGKPGKARGTKTWLKTLWRWADGEDLAAGPIMDNLNVPIPPGVRDRHYTDEEVVAIWQAAHKVKDQAKGAYFKLLLLLAPRKSALAALRWWDIKDGVWITPFEKTKSRKMSKPRTYQTPLPELAKSILAELPKDGDQVFPIVPPRPSGRFSQELIDCGAPSDFNYSCTPSRHGCRTMRPAHTKSDWFSIMPTPA
jgi:integrase